MATPQELRAKRKKLIEEARAINDIAGKENRQLSQDESEKWDKIMGEADELRSKIDREERQLEAEREMEQELRSQEEEEQRRARDNGEEARDTGGDGENRGRVIEAFRSFLSTGQATGDGAEELRALSAGVNTEGGYIVTPEVFISMLIKSLDDEVVIRRMANVIPMETGASIGIPTLDADPDDADWTTELATGSEDSSMAFGKRVMQPHPMAKRIKVSRTLLRTAALPVDQIVRDRLAYKFGITQEKAYLTGSGDKRPLGLFTASASGISTGRDISTGNSSTAITFDGLKEAKFGVKTGYMNRGTWLFHRDAIKQISKLKDGEGQYLWQDSTREGEPDRLLGRPAMVSEYVPNTFTTGQYVGMFGDFSHYWILDSMMMQLQRLDELYAESGQVGFIGRYEGDGAPVLEEAFSRVTLT